VPCDKNNCLTAFLNKYAVEGKYKARFFNLAIPSESIGDIYTILKLLDKYGVSTNSIIINLNYFEFLTDTNDTSIFWLKQQLRDVDKEAYNYDYGKAGMLSTYGIKDIAEDFKVYLEKNVAIIEYKDFIRKCFVNFVSPGYNDLVGDTRPWYKKKNLYDDIKKSDNMWYFSDKPIVMDESHSNIYFLNRILKHQSGKNTLYFLAGYNRELLSDETSKKGYNDNLLIIDQFFLNKSANYVNYDKKIDYSRFADFVHLTPSGYKYLAKDLWTRIKDSLH
jgi:hypothetical protein